MKKKNDSGFAIGIVVVAALSFIAAAVGLIPAPSFVAMIVTGSGLLYLRGKEGFMKAYSSFIYTIKIIFKTLIIILIGTIMTHLFLSVDYGWIIVILCLLLFWRMSYGKDFSWGKALEGLLMEAAMVMALSSIIVALSLELLKKWQQWRKELSDLLYFDGDWFSFEGFVKIIGIVATIVLSIIALLILVAVTTIIKNHWEILLVMLIWYLKASLVLAFLEFVGCFIFLVFILKQNNIYRVAYKSLIFCLPSGGASKIWYGAKFGSEDTDSLLEIIKTLKVKHNWDGKKIRLAHVSRVWWESLNDGLGELDRIFRPPQIF